MSDIEDFILNGKPLHKQKPNPVSDEEMFWHMHEQGKKRFGSPCSHENVVSGKCVNCLRTVITKI